jgi:trehalose/maltose hydrolase-like predicted phosphorylase
MRRGLLTTRTIWNGQPVEITALISRDDPALVACHVVAGSGVKVRVQTLAGPAGVTRDDHLLSPDGPAPRAAATTTLISAVGDRSSGSAWSETVVRRALSSGPPRTGVFSALLSRHVAAWQRLWASDIEIEGNPADQQLVHALMYQVLASVREGVKPAPGFPPMGLSNPAAFGGHVFWDADTWIYPALLPLHPELARSILDYRLRTLPGAKSNAAEESKRGASYAWESADTGREVATLQTRHGRHVTADVARAFWQYYLATGDRTWLRQQAWPVLSATAEYWVSRAQTSTSSPSLTPSPLHPFTPSSSRRWEIRQVSTPDENAGLVDNSAWTNYGAREDLRDAVRAAKILGLDADPQWTQVADGLLIPRDASGMILEYAGYKGLPAKQADTLLLLFPGDMPLPRAEQERMFRYYVDRTIRNGPAMTESVHAVIAARLGQPEDAYRRFRQSVDPFVRPPFFSFSEKRTRDNLQFLTGAAGSLQAILYGFAGLRLEDSPAPVFHPQLPAAWSSLILHGVSWRGRRYDVVLRRGQPARLTRR